MFKKIAITGGAGLALSASFAAHAQSSVTLYGIVDGGIAYTNNQRGASVVQQASGKLSGSRWGFRGQEDLGNGLKAVFTLENGFKENDGTLNQAGREFGRQAFVGIGKTGVGTLTFGRQYDPNADLLSQFSSPGFWSPATHIGDNDNMNTTIRLNNTVKFRSDPIYGVTVDALYAFSNQAAGSTGQGFGNNRAWGIAASYAHGPLAFGAGYLLLNHPDTGSNTGGAVGGASTANGDDYSGATFYGVDGGVARQQIAVAGGNYTLGDTILGASFSHAQINYNDGASRKFNNYELNLRYMLTSSLMLLGAYTYTDGRANGLPGATARTLKPRWNQLTLSADYALSKRTELYLSGVYQLASGDPSTLVGTSYKSIATIADVGTSSSSNRQVAVFTGIRMKF